jgi:transposase-like protein
MNAPTLKSRLKDAIRNLTAELHAAIAKTIVDCPDRSYKTIARDFGVSEATVLQAASRHGLSRPSGPKPRNPETQPGAANTPDPHDEEGRSHVSE